MDVQQKYKRIKNKQVLFKYLHFRLDYNIKIIFNRKLKLHFNKLKIDTL